jgi:hypothetical protein
MTGMTIDRHCCSPKSHQSIEVIALNKNTSIIGGFIPEYFDISTIKIKDILVTNCGCD